MTNEAFFNVVNNCVNMLREAAPKKTGNLAYNAIRMVYFDNEAHIIIDDAIAPYMPFTNEPWTSPKWHGKKNPNQNWFDKIALTIIASIAIRLNGDVQNKGDNKND